MNTQSTHSTSTDSDDRHRGPRLRLDRLFYRLAYRSARPRWDSDRPRPELVDLAANRQPGRALDLGCGTGTDGLYLAEHGWDVVAVDFVPKAIAMAQTRAKESGSTARFILADVSELRQTGIEGPFDLVLDIGCYHGIPESLRDAYATEVSAVTGSGAELFLAGIAKPPAPWRLVGAHGVTADELHTRFGATFDLTDEHVTGPIGRAPLFVIYRLVRHE